MLGTNEREVLVGLVGTLCLLIVSIPLFLRQNYSLFEPLTFVILLVLFGTPLKLLYVIAYRFEDAYVAKRLLNWDLPEAFLPALMVVLVGWVFFVIGYSLRLPKTGLELVYLPASREWNQKRLTVVLAITAVISIAFLAAFIVSAGVGFGSLKELSSKRFSEEAGSAATRMHQVKYYFYRGAAICKFIVYFALVHSLRRNRMFSSWMGWLFLFSLLQTMFLSFVLNNRAGVLLVLIDCMVIYYYVRQTIHYKTVIWAFVVASLLLMPMLAGRMADRAASEGTLSTLLQKTMAGRDMLDITKTCHIINGVPDKMDYIYGETLWGWMAAPVPRSIWDTKPMWAEKGPFINQHIFADKHGISGVPPGFVAELYWNFGIGGLCIGLFTFGVFLRQLFVCFMAHVDKPNAIIIYTLLVTRFGMFTFGNDLGTGIVKASLDLMPAVIILVFISQKSQNEHDFVPQEQTESIPKFVHPSNLEPAQAIRRGIN